MSLVSGPRLSNGSPLLKVSPGPRHSCLSFPLAAWESSRDFLQPSAGRCSQAFVLDDAASVPVGFICGFLSSHPASPHNSVTISFWSPRLRGKSDSSVRFPQRKPSSYREGPPFARPGGADLWLGHLHDRAHFAWRVVCVRAPLAAPGKGRRYHSPAPGIHGGENPRESPRTDSRQQCHGRQRSHLSDLQLRWVLAKPRTAPADRSNHLHCWPARAPGDRPPGTARTWAPRRFAASRSENHLLAQ